MQINAFILPGKLASMTIAWALHLDGRKSRMQVTAEALCGAGPVAALLGAPFAPCFKQIGAPDPIAGGDSAAISDKGGHRAA